MPKPRFLGEDFRRAATETELYEMSLLLRQDLDAGALGLAAGLESDPGIYSDPSEVVALARVAAAQGGRYISHLRSEDRHFPEALDEILAISQAAGIPVQISHMKLAMTSLWGRAPEFLEKLDAALAASSRGPARPNRAGSCGFSDQGWCCSSSSGIS